MSDIKFGTDGWRAVVDRDFNKENVEKVIKSIGKYVFDTFGSDKTVLVGYDPRNKAPEFAEFSADLLAKMGLKVLISDKIIATPILAYSAKELNACAVMFTASHNPPEYLGIKFIPDYGGPATNEITNELTENLNKEINAFSSPKNPVRYSFEEDYVKEIEKIIDFDRIKSSNISINYDGHHGAAAGTFKFILDKHGIKNNSFHLERDVKFGGFMPDPKEKYLPELKKICKENHLAGMSNDGDGDRFGVFNENGDFVSANEIICILLLHLVKNKGFTGKLAKTVGASSMLDAVAKKSGIDVVLTPVGFKWLGEVMRKDDIIIGGEESGGLSIKGHIPEKDGILANLLILEAMAYSGKKLFELQREIKNFAGCEFFSDRYDFEFETKEEQERVLAKFVNLNEFCGRKVKEKITIDGIKYIFEDGSSILVRKSGTEPLLRIYLEAKDKFTLEKIGNSVNIFVK